MTTEIDQIIKYHSESSVLDFKREHYELGKHIKRNEILKDISSFANHLSNHPKYIIIGIKEKNGIADEIFDIDDSKDEAIFQQFVFDNIEPKINFEFKYTTYENKKIAYFKIFENFDRPYLFKKDVINPSNNKTDFQKGDGYIRLGTSTKKLDRNDFEEIYKLKFSSYDRKDDLLINSYFNNPNDSDLTELEIKYIDIEIINNSNKSIDFEVEMKVYKGEGFSIISETDLKSIIFEQKSNYPFAISIEMAQIPNLFVTFKDEKDYVLITRNTLNRKAAVSLPQHSSEADIFFQQIFVLSENPSEIKADLIVRSDDFVDGPLKRELVFKQ